MNTTEAYELTLEKVKELEDASIEVTISPCPSINNTGVGKDCKLDRNKWVHVKFKINNITDRVKVNEAANYLGMAGIVFDTSGTKWERSWELDWSFEYTGKDNQDWRDALEDVEDMIERK